MPPLPLNWNSCSKIFYYRITLPTNNATMNVIFFQLFFDTAPLTFGFWFVFYVPSTAMSFRDGTPIYCPLRRRWSSFLHRSHRESNPGSSRGSPLHYHCATRASRMILFLVYNTFRGLMCLFFHQVYSSMIL